MQNVINTIPLGVILLGFGVSFSGYWTVCSVFSGLMSRRKFLETLLVALFAVLLSLAIVFFR